MRGNREAETPKADYPSSPRVLIRLRRIFGDSKGQSPFVLRGNPSSPRVLRKNLFGDSKGQSPFAM